MNEFLRSQEELNMKKDADWKEFFSDDERYADIINGLACQGKQIVSKDDLSEMDTQTGFYKARKLFLKASRKGIKFRDMIRRTAFGVNFAVIGLEHQEEIDYALAVRNMSYDVGEYERQMSKVRREVRRGPAELKASEYLYGFRKSDKLHPVITFVLYYGEEPWDGPTSLHEMLDFTDFPEGVRRLIPDYQINLIEIRKFEHTEVFKTDVKQVFDFIRCAEDKQALRRLVVEDEYYQSMEEDAFDVVVNYTNSLELVEVKNILKEKDGKVNMCKGLRDWIEEERQEGKKEGREEGVVALVNTCKSLNASREITIQKLQEQFGLLEEIATEKVEMYWN